MVCYSAVSFWAGTAHLRHVRAERLDMSISRQAGTVENVRRNPVCRPVFPFSRISVLKCRLVPFMTVKTITEKQRAQTLNTVDSPGTKTLRNSGSLLLVVKKTKLFICKILKLKLYYVL